MKELLPNHEEKSAKFEFLRPLVEKIMEDKTVSLLAITGTEVILAAVTAISYFINPNPGLIVVWSGIASALLIAAAVVVDSEYSRT